MALSFLYVAFVRILHLVRLSRNGRQDLAIEIVMLRHEVAVLRRQVARPALKPADRAVFAGLSRLLSIARRGRFFVQPETLLRCHRELMRQKWTYSRRRPGQPAIPAGTVTLVVCLAWENPSWGYRRIHGGAGHHGRSACSFERVGNPSPGWHRAHSSPNGPDLG